MTPSTRKSLQAMGMAYFSMQRPDDALKNFQESLDIKSASA